MEVDPYHARYCVNAMSGSNGNDLGFTLLEMLVSITLLAIFSVIISGALHFGLRADGALNAQSVGEDDVTRTELFLRGRISVAQPVWVRAGHSGYVDFEGRRDAMLFLAPTLDSFGGVGLTGYMLSVQHDGDRSHLAVRLIGIEGQSASLELGSAQFLSSASAIEFAYYGRQPDSHVFGWQPVWSERRELPMLVLVQAWASGARRQMILDAAIHPRIDIDVDCQLSVQTASCLGR